MDERRVPFRRPWLAAMALVLSVPACDVSSYAFRVDESIEIVQPRARTTVALPVTVRWTDDEPPAQLRADPLDPRAGYYAVFVDRAPIRPRDDLASLADDARLCRAQRGCPTEALLSDRGVYLTADRRVTLEFLPDLRPTARGGAKDTHEVTVVRMRGDARVGEAAWDQTFFVER